jgi:hypothetical protein
LYVVIETFRERVTGAPPQTGHAKA